MKITNWKKFNESSNGARWERNTKSKTAKKAVYVVPLNLKGNSTGTIRTGHTLNGVPKNQNFTRIKLSGWEMGVLSHSKGHYNKKFKTKLEAKKYALNWMKKHPNG